MKLQICATLLIFLQSLLLQGQQDVPSASPQDAVQWLGSLIREDRLKLSMDEESFTSRLLTEPLPDGRTWADFLEHSIGASGDWVYIDEAVRLLINQADTIASKVTESNNDFKRNQWRQLRKACLEMATRLLQRYAQLVGGAFDEKSNYLQASSLLPDISFSSDITLHRIAGSGKIHTGTFDFQGRLSGEVALPGLETRFTVPNLSFDSRGNFDIVAYGVTSMPPGKPTQVQLMVPPRRPLELHVDSGGDFSIGGGLRLTLPDGNQVEGFFNVDDPKYRFGIAFSGRATLELAKLSARLPTIDINATSFGTMESISGLGQVLGGFSRGIESFLTQAPELPSPSDIEIGQPPEFSPPETVVPVDIVEAWAIGLANASVRNAMNLSIEQKNEFSEQIREVIDELKTSLISLQAEQAATLTVAKKMNRFNDLNSNISKLLTDEATNQLLGEENSDSFTEQVIEASAQSVSITKSLMEEAEDFKAGLASVRVYMDADANHALLGGNSETIDTDLIIGKIDDWTDVFLGSYGVDHEGTIIDQDKVDRWDEDECLILLHLWADLSANKQILGEAELDFGLCKIAARRLFLKSRDRYQQSMSNRDLEGRVSSARFLLECYTIYIAIDALNDASDEDLNLMAKAWFETFDAVAQRGSVGKVGQKLAHAFAEVGNRHFETRNEIARRRVDELLLAKEENSTHPTELPLRYTFMDEASTLWSTFHSLFEESSPGLETDSQKNTLLAYAQSIIVDSNERSADVATLETDLEGGLIRLRMMLDALAFLDKHLPGETELIGQFKTSWQELHDRWTEMAELQKYHWMLGNYIETLAEVSQRYGDEVSQPLQNAWLESGRQTLEGMARIGEGLGIQFEAIGSNDFDMLLPGDLELRSIYGEVEFDRDNFDWGLKLGGRLEFPDINASFDVPVATVNNQGEFELSLIARSDRAFGLNDNFSLNLIFPNFKGQLPFVSGLQPDGSPKFAQAALSSFSGRGALIQRSDKTSYDARVEYTSDLDGDREGPDGHRFKIEAAFNGKQELFTQEIMLFSGDIGFELETQLDGNPTQVGTEVASSAGVWLRPESVEKAPEERTEDDYYLNFTGSAKLDYSIEEGFLELSLMSGQLMLPQDVFTGSENTDPLITLLEPICIRIDPNNPDQPIFWCNDEGNAASIQFTNIGFKVPGMDFMHGEMESATLNFNQSLLPSISNVTGFMELDLHPDPDDNIRLDLNGAAWTLTGFPVGTIALGNDVRLFEASGFGMDILGGNSCSSGEGGQAVSSGLTLFKAEEDLMPKIRLDGGMRFFLPPDILFLEDTEETSQLENNEEGQLSFLSCGALELSPGDNGFPVPTFEFEQLAFEATSMRLGGKKGIQLKEVELEIRGIQGFFNNFTDGPALVQLTGELQIDHGPSFTLKNAQIQLNQNLLPTFIAPERTTISVEEMELFEGFPIRITEAGLGFKDRELLLPDLVGPENIIISTSAEIVIEAEVVSLSGQVDDLSFEIEDGKTQVALDGFGFGIEALEIPPLGLSGEVYIRGLQDPGVNFENVYFSGLLGGQLSTAGVTAMVALTPQRLVGICLDVNAGPSGIPLGQTTLLFTGASGGVTFANDNKDPCEFLAEFPVAAAVGANPQAMQPQSIRPDRNINEYGMTWEDLDARVSEQIYRDAVADQFQTAMEDAGPIGQSDFSGPFQTTAVSTTAEQDVAGLEIPCPNADCPPTTVNILCQPHPDQELFPNKVIIKFTSLDRHQATDILDELGFTPQALEALGVDNATIIAEDLSEFIRSIMEGLIPPGLPELVGEDLAKALNAEREKILSKITDSFNASIRNGIENAFNEETDIYEAVLKVFYAGVPCPDVAVSLKGTFSQALVSSFLSVKGGGVLSSAGAVGLVGDLNIIGMPIGKFRGFAMGTDSEGLPNPSLCGTMDMQIGPISAAQSRMAFTCEECITGFLEAFGGLAGCLLNESGEAVETAIREALAKVAPQHRDLGAAALDAELSIEQKTALFAQIFHHPPEVLQFSDCFVNSLIAAIEAVNPVFRSCMTGPKIFGISMGGTVKGVQLEITKDGMAGAGTISPSKVFLAAAGAGTIFSVAAELFPPLDELTLSLGSEVFQPSELFIAALKGKLTSPEKFTTFIEDGFERMLTRTTYGIQHKFNPMGFDLLDNQARLVMPNLIQHPVFPSTDWQGPPESRGLPSRAKVLMAALGQEFLGNALWKGDEEDLHTIFPQGTPDQSALLGKSFGTDYFPHGGIVAAGRLALPSILSELPPEEIGIAVGNGDYFKRLEAAKHVVDNYILKTTNAGKLAMYLPAPNPPIMTNDAGENLTPKELFDAILSADPTQLALAPFYPVELLFIKGTLSGRILGVPIMEAELIGYAPNAQTGESGKLEAMTQIPSDSWLNPFLEEAALSVTFTQAPPLSIEDYFLVVQERLQSAITLGESQEISELETLLEDIRADFVNALPKASITASLDRLRIPEPFEDVLIPAETSASFSAFSPLYDPEVDKKDPLAEVKIKGGMAFEASAMIAGFLNMPEMVLSVIPPTATTLPSLHAKGKVEPFEFPPGEGFQLFEVVSPIGDDTLEATADFNSDGSVQISIDPIRVSSPLITSGNLMRVYGEVPTEPLSIRSNAPWSATLEFGGASQINFPDGTPALRFGEVDDKFQATIKGEGMDQASIHLEMNHSLNVTAFPGNPNLEQIIPLDVSSNQGIELFVNSDGTFYLEGSVGENFSVPLVNLPVTELKTEARVRISNEGMRVEGKYAGGALSLLGIPEVTGLLEISLTSGVLFEANASIPASSLPLHFGVFEVDALRDGEDIPLIVSNTGFEVGSSVLSIPGISVDVITLESMQLLSNGDFTSIGSNGGLSLPNFFSVASGSFSFVKEGPDVSLSFAAPSVTLLPNSPMETVLQAPVDQLLIESNGRMYVDSGRQTIPLPGFASATGRVEFGYEPEGAMPLPEVDVRLVDFGVVDVGSNAVKTVRVTNLGGATLVGSSVVELEFPTFQVTPPLYVLEPGEAIDLEVYYFPKTTERVNGVLNLPSTRFEDLKVVLTGQGRSRPQFHTSVTDVLDFGEQAVGGGLNRQLSISNLGTETLRVTESQLTGPFTVSPSTFEIAPGKTQGLFLTFRPNAQEGYVSKLTWQTNEPEKSRSLNLVGVGTQVRWYEQRDSGPIIRDLFMVNAKVGWAVGDQGTLLKTTTGGRAWTPYKSPTMRTLNAVAFGSDGVKGWIAGDAGTVFETEDSGVTWAPVTHEEVQNPALSWKDAGVSGQRLVLVGEDSSNGQAALTYQNTNTSYRSVEISGMQGLYGVSTHEKWVGAVGSNGLLVYSFNGGIRWKESYIDGASAVRFNGVTIDENGSAVAVAGGGLVYHTIKLGESWSRIEETNTTQNLFAAERSGDSLWVSGASGVLIHSVDGGANWTTESINTGASLYAVASKEGLVWAAGRRGEIHHRPDESPSTPRLLLSSDRLDFGVRLPGQVSSQSIVVRNDGPETMTFESASVTGDSEFSVQGIDLASLAPGQSARIRVLFSPAEPGLKTGAIVLRPVGDLLDSFEISYRGESAGSSWSPIATPTTEHVEDLQFLNDQLGFAIDEDEVYRTEDGGESWNALNANPPGPLKRIKFLNPTIGFGYGGKGGSNSTLIKTTDGGSTWKVLDTGVRHRITDVVAPIPGNAQILFAMTKWYAGGNNNKYAVILRSTNGGDSWTTIGRPSQVFLGGEAIHVQSNLNTLFVAGGNILYRSTNGGSSWTQVLKFSGSKLINDIEFLDDNHGWLVGESGLFRRTETGGASSSDWLKPASLSAGKLRRIRFIDSNNGWIAGEGSFSNNAEPALFRTIDGGRTWSNTLVDGDFTVRSVSPISADQAFAGGTDGNLVEYTPAETVSFGLITATEVVDFGEVEQGELASGSVEYANVGDKAVKLLGLQFDIEKSVGAFRYEGSVPESLAPGASFQVDVFFRSGSAGGFDDSLRLLNDGFSSVVETDLSAVVSMSEGILILDTHPSGLPLIVSGIEQVTPIAFTIRPGTDGETGVVSPGEKLSIEAPETIQQSFLSYQFVDWKPFQKRQFILEVPEFSSRFEAQYEGVLSSRANVIHQPVPGRIPSPRPRATTPPVLVSEILGSVDPPPGPWIRLSGPGLQEAAEISHPLLGEFPLNISAYFSSKEFELSLGSRILQIPNDAVTGDEWLSVNPGSLDLSYREGEWFRLLAASGSVSIWGVPSPGAGHVSFDFNPPTDQVLIPPTNQVLIPPTKPGATPASAGYRAVLTLDSDTSILPNIFEFGAGSQLVFDTHGEPSMEFNGRLRMFKSPTGDWVYNKNFDFNVGLQEFEIEVDDLVANSPIWSNGFIRLLVGSNSPRLFFRKGGNGYEGGISNLQLGLFGESITVAEAVAGSDGNFSLTIDQGEIELNNLMRLKTDNDSQLKWNIFNGAYELSLSKGNIDIVNSDAWPVSGVPLPGFKLTGSSFQETFDFEPFQFSGIPLSEPQQGDSYFRLNGSNEEIGFAVFGEFSTQIGNLTVEIHITSDGGLTAFASGEVSNDFFSSSTELVYDSANVKWPFSGTFTVGPVEYCVRVGPSNNGEIPRGEIYVCP